jgi:hypothetical protein
MRAKQFGIASPNLFLYHFMKFHGMQSTSKCVKCVDKQQGSSNLACQPNSKQALKVMPLK